MSADDIFFWGNWVLLGALVVGLLATYAVVASGNIRDQELKRELKDKDGKIAEANARGEEARAEAAKANLELERLKAPRTLTDEQQLRMGEKLKAFRGTTFEMVTYPGLIEPAQFSATISALLVRAEWALNVHTGKHFLLENGSGVVVVASTQGSPGADRVARALLESLVSEGVAARLDHDSLKVNPIKIDIQIQVGLK